MNKRSQVVALVLAMAATACGGGNGNTGVSGPATSSGDASARHVAFEFLGDLVVAADPVVQQILDTSGGVLRLSDGTEVIAPADALAASVEVSAQSADLDLAPFFDKAPWGRAYVVSTPEDVTLAEPIVIEIPRPADGLRAVQLIGDEIVAVPVLGEETARIEIPHFSDVVTMVVEAFGEERARVEAPDPGQADADFFNSCFIAVSAIYGGSVFDAPDLGNDEEASFAQNLALSVCTTALVRRASPSGVTVATECVADRIGGEVDLRGAIAACSTDSEPDPDGSEAEADDPSDDDVSEPSIGTFFMEIPYGPENCPDSELVGADARLTFDEDGTVVASGGLTCVDDEGPSTATLSGAGTWSVESGNFEITIAMTGESGTAEGVWSGRVDIAGGTVELLGEVLPISR